jgi:hypothetical protein
MSQMIMCCLYSKQCQILTLQNLSTLRLHLLTMRIILFQYDALSVGKSPESVTTINNNNNNNNNYYYYCCCYYYCTILINSTVIHHGHQCSVKNQHLSQVTKPSVKEVQCVTKPKSSNLSQEMAILQVLCLFVHFGSRSSSD